MLDHVIALNEQHLRRLVRDYVSYFHEDRKNGHCRQTFGKEKIDLNLLRFAVEQTRFYDVAGREGNLKFSAVVGKLASPDQMLRVLASEVEADAFVLGYYDANRYVRTRHVVLTHGYHATGPKRWEVARHHDGREAKSAAA